MALLALPLFLNDYTQYVVNLVLVYVLVGVGFNIVLGNLGQLAFANAAFYGIGAYATGHSAAPLQGAAAARRLPPAPSPAGSPARLSRLPASCAASARSTSPSLRWPSAS